MMIKMIGLMQPKVQNQQTLGEIQHLLVLIIKRSGLISFDPQGLLSGIPPNPLGQSRPLKVQAIRVSWWEPSSPQGFR